MEIYKRDGRKVDYKKEKIFIAIEKVFKEVGNANFSDSLIDHLTDRVEKEIKELGTPHVEEIQDTVEDVLIEEGYKNIAKAYIRYREEHARKRKEWLKEELPLSIWQRKYQFRGESFEEFFERVAKSNERAKSLIKKKKFLPAGRILANRGLNKYGIKVTYSNCYVTEPPKDNLESIIDAGKRLARTFSYGGGSGIDISKLRPKNARVQNAAKTTSGSVSFLDIYDTISKSIGQKGRRAALMVSLICEHPDIEDFIEKKLDLDAVNKANMSVRITNDFMEKAIQNEEIDLTFYVEDTGEEIIKTVNANKLLNKLAYGNWYSGEPGMLFWDRIESYNLLEQYDDFEFSGTNPCGEEPLPAGGSCLLGAINLSEFVDNKFTDYATFNFKEFENAVEIAVEYLNEVLEEGLPLHPLEEQRKAVEKWRQIGLGIMGLGTMLIKMGIKYGSLESLEISKKIGKIMANKAMQTSALIAKEKGTFPAYKEEPTLNSYFLNNVATKETVDLIKKYGLRNSQLLTIAPTGSISNICEVSGGIEPIYQVSYIRTTKSLHDEDKEYKVFSPAVRELMEVKGIESEDDLPDYVIDAHQLNYQERILMQSTWQEYIDASISSTVNLPNEATVEDIKDLYTKAWEAGLKGITVFRDGCARVGILKGKEEMKNKKTEMTDQDWIDAGICPECKNDLDMTGGCKECKSCGFQLCGI
ncbi:MAG: adenosylcobalamin-dependent ribonucleoside-diphosphate reductase [Halanaerobiales bacterium]